MNYEYYLYFYLKIPLKTQLASWVHHPKEIQWFFFFFIRRDGWQLFSSMQVWEQLVSQTKKSSKGE